MKLLSEAIVETILALSPGGKIVIDKKMSTDGEQWFCARIEDAQGQVCSSGACPVRYDLITSTEAFDPVLRALLDGGARSMEDRERMIKDKVRLL